LSSPIKIAEYSGFIGLNNLQDPRFIKDNELAKAINVDINDTGKVTSISSPVKISDNTFSNFFKSEKGILYAISNGNLVRIINDNLDYEIITSGFRNDFVSFAEYYDRIFVSDGHRIGNIINNDFKDFDTYQIDKYNVKIPAGNIIEVFRGRLYSAVYDYLYFSNVMKFHQVKIPFGYIGFGSIITNLKSINNGIYVSTVDDLFFLRGTKPDEFEKVHIAHIKVLPNSMVKLNTQAISDELNIKQIINSYTSGEQFAVFFLTTDGIFCGLNNGRIFNIADGRYGKIPYGRTTSINSENKLIYLL